MATVPYTKLAFIQRIRKHVANARATNDEFQASDKEILLLIDSALAVGCVGQMFNNAKIEGNMATPEAYLTTYLLSALVSGADGSWQATLPQTPISMPLGYSIDRVYFTDPTYGVSKDAYPIRPKELSYLSMLPAPYGIAYWVENIIIHFKATNNIPLLTLTPYVRMIKTRTSDVNEDMALPDDAIDAIFTKVVAQLMQRYGVPQDIIKDDLGAGNKSS